MIMGFQNSLCILDRTGSCAPEHHVMSLADRRARRHDLCLRLPSVICYQYLYMVSFFISGIEHRRNRARLIGEGGGEMAIVRVTRRDGKIGRPAPMAVNPGVDR